MNINYTIVFTLKLKRLKLCFLIVLDSFSHTTAHNATLCGEMWCEMTHILVQFNCNSLALSTQYFITVYFHWLNSSNYTKYNIVFKMVQSLMSCLPTYLYMDSPGWSKCTGLFRNTWIPHFIYRFGIFIVKIYWLGVFPQNPYIFCQFRPHGKRPHGIQ